MHVYFIDTSVLCHLLEVPGRSDPTQAAELQELLRERFAAGARFVLPITAIVETGNFIAQCTGDRHAAAKRFHNALKAAASDSPPWLIHDIAWNSAFVETLLAGDGTGATLIDHFTAKTLGAGDLTILVERDRYAASRSFHTVEIWTIDAKLAAYC